MRQILSKRLTLRGFIYYDFAAEHYADFLRDVGAAASATARTSSTVSKTRRPLSSECWRGVTSAS